LFVSIPAPKAVVLLSGGLDSATLLAVANRQGYLCHCLSFRYGQRHAVELDAAKRVAQHEQAAAHRIIDIDLRAFGGSALTDDLQVPKDRSAADMAGEIPITYVPARNTIFLSYALGWAEILGAGAIYIGVNAVDYSGYPDCRPEFVKAFQGVANVATKAAVEGHPTRLVSPLIHLTKAQIILTGIELGVDYGLTHSCYDPVGSLACGRCDSCQIRRDGFREAGIPDPTRYAGATG
jgi:7-cyano-7-deazaguanine synthase